MQHTSRLRSIQKQARKTKILAFDMGSTQTRISSEGKQIWQEATCLAVHPQSRMAISIGTAAYRLLGKRTSKTELIFPIEYAAVGSMHYAVEYLRILREQLGWGASWMGGMNQPIVYCGMYDSLSPLEKQQFAHCFSEAGWTKVRFYSAALAALQASKRSSLDTPHCIIDIGGQSTELAIAHGEQVIASTKITWGGLTFTDAIQRLIIAKYHCAVSWHTTEAVKKELAFVTTNEIPRAMKQKKYSIAGKDITSQLGKTVVVEAEPVIEAVSQLPETLITNIQHFFAALPAEIVTSCLEQGIVLTGGGAKLEGMVEYLRQTLKTEISISDSPEADILRGLEVVAST
ncbi:MAG: rod shape-determining protein [Patescibacteria group bacterium]